MVTPATPQAPLPPGTGKIKPLVMSGLLLTTAAVVGLWMTRRTASPPARPQAPEKTGRTGHTTAPEPVPGPESWTQARVAQPGPPEEPVMLFPPPQPAGPSPRQLVLVASGLVLAATATAGAWLTWNAPPSRSLAPSKPQLLVSATQETGSCQMAPAAAIAGVTDGRFPLMADLSGLIAADIASLVVLGQEVALARPRDAEVAFLMSCRLADQLKGADSVESADAKHQLALHYARVGLEANPAGGAQRAEMMRRAELLHTESLKTYHARFGKTHEKSRVVADGLVAARRGLAQAEVKRPPLALAPVPAPVPALVPAPSPRTQRPIQSASFRTTEPLNPALHSRAVPAKPAAPSALKAQPGKAVVAKTAPYTVQPRQKIRASAQPGPSFNCAKARSVSEKMICSDAQLAQLDYDLGRLHARAKKAAPDSAAFRRHSDQAWLRREATCRDRQCLVRWYAERRDHLIGHIEGRGQAPARNSG